MCLGWTSHPLEWSCSSPELLTRCTNQDRPAVSAKGLSDQDQCPLFHKCCLSEINLSNIVNKRTDRGLLYLFVLSANCSDNFSPLFPLLIATHLSSRRNVHVTAMHCLFPHITYLPSPDLGEIQKSWKRKYHFSLLHFSLPL